MLPAIAEPPLAPGEPADVPGPLEEGLLAHAAVPIRENKGSNVRGCRMNAMEFTFAVIECGLPPTTLRKRALRLAHLSDAKTVMQTEPLRFEAARGAWRGARVVVVSAS